VLTNYICAIDISSSKICAVVAQTKGRRITNIFFESLPSKGIKRGVIVDSIALVGSISQALKNLKSRSGINIKFIYANISGQDIVTKHSRAIVPLAERGNKVITPSDIQKVSEQARVLGSSLEEEIIHSMPFSYSIDSKNNIINPLGLYSHRLEVDLYLICGKLSSIQSFSRAVNQAGYDIKDLFFSGIATSRVVFSDELREGIHVLCDIGSDITELLVFSDGLLKEVQVLSVGGDDLTKQLSEDLNIPLDLAEEVKRSYASVGDSSLIKEDKEILIKRDNIYKPIKQRVVSEILTAKTKSICLNIKSAVEKIIPAERVGDFVTTGRTVLLEGFLETLENTLGVSVRLGRIANPDIASLTNKEEAMSGQKYLTYINSLGLIAQALHEQQPWFISSQQTARNPLIKTIHKFKEIYQEYF
jgi:cell division protein FtsA